MRERGAMALIMTVITAILFTLLSGAVAQNLSSELKQSVSFLDEARAGYAADAGVEDALQRVGDTASCSESDVSSSPLNFLGIGAIGNAVTTDATDPGAKWIHNNVTVAGGGAFGGAVSVSVIGQAGQTYQTRTYSTTKSCPFNPCSVNCNPGSGSCSVICLSMTFYSCSLAPEGAYLTAQAAGVNGGVAQTIYPGPWWSGSLCRFPINAAPKMVDLTSYGFSNNTGITFVFHATGSFKSEGSTTVFDVTVTKNGGSLVRPTFHYDNPSSCSGTCGAPTIPDPTGNGIRLNHIGTATGST